MRNRNPPRQVVARAVRPRVRGVVNARNRQYLPAHDVVILAFGEKIARFPRLETQRFAQRPSRLIAVARRLAYADEYLVLDGVRAVAPIQPREIGIDAARLRPKRRPRNGMRRRFAAAPALQPPVAVAVYVDEPVLFVLQAVDFVKRPRAPQRRTPRRLHKLSARVKPPRCPISARVV